MQILAVQHPAYRVAIAKTLMTFPTGDDVTVAALVRLALYDPDAGVRNSAILALGRESPTLYGPRLLQGFRHPWHVVAERAAEALVHLRRSELLPKLAEFLDEPDPAAPFKREDGGKKELVVREMVRINHHSNCMLCHRPANHDDERDNLGLIARVPSPDVELPPAISREYYSSVTDSPAVLATETYLRQDFSIMQTAENPGKWPALQRFDFLVRTRTLTPSEVAKAAPTPADVPSVNQQAALGVLHRMTTGNTGSKSGDWKTAIARRLAEDARP
jgi:hypothetical protein